MTKFDEILAAWHAEIQYFQTLGYDSEWTDYNSKYPPTEQASRLAWRIKP